MVTAHDVVEQILKEAAERPEYFRCPKCRYEFQHEDVSRPLITLWADQHGWIEEECPNCEVAFEVQERIERTYEVRLPAEDQGDDADG